MLTRLAQFVVRRRKRILVGALAFLIVAGAVGGSVASHLNSGGFDNPSSESSKVSTLLDRQFHTGDPNLVLVVRAVHGTVDDPAVAAEGTALAKATAAQAHVGQAISYWTLGNAPPLRSKDSTEALVLARVSGTDDQVNQRIVSIASALNRHDANISVTVTGFAQVFHQVGETIKKDLARAESIAIPITLVLLILVFGSAVAATLPLAVGALAVIGTFLALRLLVAVTHVSIFSLNLTTALGLSLAIDYSLFIVSRYREELHAGREPSAAVIRSMETAGRTVLFSALTVAASLAALLVFPLYFLRSFAYAGIAVVAIAAFGAVVILPALLAVVGHNIDRLRLFKTHPKEVGEGFWHRLAVIVMRRPLPIATAIIAILLFLGAPFLNVHFGLPDDRVLPTSATSRQGLSEIRANFASNESFALSVVAPTAPDPASSMATQATQAAQATQAQTAIASYAAELSQLPNVARVDAYSGSYIAGHQVLGTNPFSQTRFSTPGGTPGTWLSVVPSVSLDPMSGAAEHLVHLVRQAPAPWPVKVGGSSARLVDSKSSLFGKLPLALGIIALVTLITLFMMFGSILVPIKAVVLNLLGLTATFGAMVWVFQEGHGSGLLHFTATGSLDTTTPILMFCIAFGVSMDYEVFLLSRIKEEHDNGADTTSSVAVGLERTGRLVTALALIIAIVFIANISSSITFIKLFGLGLALAVLMDATLIRGTLVPAFMRLMGDANWWAPGPLRRFHDRFGVSDGERTTPAAPTQRAAIDLTDGYSSLYVAAVLEAVDQCASSADVDQLLADEGLTAAQLASWRAGQNDTRRLVDR
ncbi:MAG TPA: MMPL family transporter [Acidimicrobiales bacterium]|nr:MMPL family transporter [Acidimicrobiales bacterium]